MAAGLLSSLGRADFFLNSGRPMKVREFLVVLALTLLIVILLAVVLLHGCDLIGNAPLSPAFG